MNQLAATFPLGSITTWLSGGTPDRHNPAYWGGSIPWISAASLKHTQVRDSDQRVTEAGVRAGSRLAPTGATLILVRGMALHRETRVGLAVRPVSFNQDVKALVPQAGVLPEFLVYSIQARARQVLDLVSVAGSGTGVLDTGLLKRLPIWLPSLDEQRRIVEVIRDVDKLIDSLERMISKKQVIKRGMMQRLLTGNTRLPGFSETWSRTVVGAISDVKTGPFGSALHESDYVSSGTPIITVEHLGDRRVVADSVPMVSEADRRRLSAYSLCQGDVVFSRVGSIDRNAMISDREQGWLFSGRLLRVRFDKKRADPGFMSAQFHAKPFREAVRSVAVGQTMPSLNTAILRGIAIDLPPLDEQKAIGEVVTDTNLILDTLEERLAKARMTKTGIMQELLTGHTRLPIKKGRT